MLWKYGIDMKNLGKYIVVTAMLLGLPACTSMHMDPAIGKPASLSMTPPPGPPEYQQGWADGCETGIAGYGNSFTKMFYTAKKDATYVYNPVYNQVWRDAYAYCRVFMKTAQLHGYGNHSNEFGLPALFTMPKVFEDVSS